jgi:deoxyribodipyrimidine photo-lyase
MTTTIWWIRRDLRLHDNPALRAAGEQGAPVPVYILDPVLLRAESSARQAFLFDGLRRLDIALRACGSRLIVRRGKPVEQLALLAEETGAEAIHALEDYSPYARRRDEQVSRLLSLPLKLETGVTLHHPLMLRKLDGRPYTVFTPFSRAWKALPITSIPITAPEHLPYPPEVHSEVIPFSGDHGSFPAGEEQALRRLADFLSARGSAYASARNRLDLEGTSELSPYLRFGMLSPRLAIFRTLDCVQAAGDGMAKKGYETFLNELIWREFYHAILYEFPQVLSAAFQPAMRDITWRDDPAGLEAWQEGRTGYPIVDACMRQLAQTGWMHNRGRMIVASFLTKDLLINWRLGEEWFMRRLVDGDPAANNGGWQWTAGVGVDAAPYFRVFNPVLQGQKFDPQGNFVRRWVPELQNVPDTFIHTPWTLPENDQLRIGLRIGVDYPFPIVDHGAARQRALETYGRAKPFSG